MRRSSGSGASAIRCPACGGRTSVSETRANPSGARRRRACEDASCATKFTTQEVIVGRIGDARADGVYYVVPAHVVRKARVATRELEEFVALVGETGVRLDRWTSALVDDAGAPATGVDGEDPPPSATREETTGTDRDAAGADSEDPLPEDGER